MCEEPLTGASGEETHKVLKERGLHRHSRGGEDTGNYIVSGKQWEDEGFWKDEGITNNILPGKIGRGSHGGSGGLTSIPTSSMLLPN